MFSDLTSQDRQFAMEMRQIFASFWPIINPVYARATGVDGTNLPHYMPRIRKTASKQAVEEMFTQYAMVEAHITPFPGSLKERRSTSTAPFAQVGLMDTYMNFRDTMSHWVATRDIAARMQRYMKNKAIREAINKVTGGKFNKKQNEWRDSYVVELMDYHLKGLVSQGRTDGVIRAPFMAMFRRNISRYYLVKPRQAPLQVASAFMAIQQEGVGGINFVKGLASFMRDPVGATKLLEQALSMHERYANMIIELKEIRDKALEGSGKMNFFDKHAFFFVKAGNKGGVILGGWVVFRAEYQRSGDVDKAFKAFDTFVLNTQQSALREQQTAATIGAWKFFFQFASAQGQYGRAYYDAWTNLVKDPSVKNAQQWARTMVVLHGLIPAARWWIAQLFLPDDDEEMEEKKRAMLIGAMIAGPFSGIWILGNMTNIASYLIAGYRGFDTGPAVVSQMNKTEKILGEALAKAMDEDSDPEEVLTDLLRAGKETVGLGAGIPGEASDIIRAMYLHSQGEFEASDIPGIGFGQSIDMINYYRGDY